MDELLRMILDRLGIERLLPHQEEIIEELKEGKNLIIISPTSSGKTLPILWLVGKYVRSGRRVIYGVPSIALRNEKAKELKEVLDFAVVKRVGEENLQGADVVVGTFEQLYLYFLFNQDLLRSFSLIILDDFHTLYDISRGFNLEKLVTLAILNDLRIVGMSATLEPCEKLARWIRGDYIKFGKEVRIIPLEYRVLELKNDERVVDKIEEDMAPCIIFCSKKDLAERRAKELSKKLKSSLLNFYEEGRVKKRLSFKEVIERFEREGIEITEYEEELAECISCGVAWHHSWVDRKARGLIEEWYNEGYIDFIFATPTLAYGFNSPTKTVIIADIKRWDPNIRKARYIPVYEWVQMAGRAGRLGYSERGVVYTCARSKEDVKVIESRYHAEDIEECESSLVEDDLFRRAILELIYAGINEDDKIKEFFLNTYYYTQRKVRLIEPDIEEELRTHIKALYELGYIYPTPAGYKLTDFGRIIAEFLTKSYRWYRLDELSALREEIKGMGRVEKAERAVAIVLKHLSPLWLEVPDDEGRKKIDEWFKERYGRYPERYEYTVYIVLNEWVRGKRIEEIEKEYGRWAIYVKSIAEDLANALKLFKDIAKLEKVEIPEDFDLMIEMVRYGLSAYEVPLIRVKGFGRVRIHNLYEKMKTVPAISKRLKENRDKTIIETLCWYFNERGEKNFKKDLERWNVKYVGEKLIERLVEFLKDNCI